MHELIQEVEYSVDLWAGDRLDFDPLGELVDGHQDSIPLAQLARAQSCRAPSKQRAMLVVW
jgi:hypothetical protein